MSTCQTADEKSRFFRAGKIQVGRLQRFINFAGAYFEGGHPCLGLGDIQGQGRTPPFASRAQPDAHSCEVSFVSFVFSHRFPTVRASPSTSPRSPTEPEEEAAYLGLLFMEPGRRRTTAPRPSPNGGRAGTWVIWSGMGA